MRCLTLPGFDTIVLTVGANARSKFTEHFAVISMIFNEY